LGGSENEISRKAAALANRLRLVQMDFADDSRDARRDQLCEEIERATASMLPEERRALLEELADRFPSWDTNVQAAPVPTAAPAPRSTMDERELSDPSFLAHRLSEIAAELSAEQRRAIGEHLREAGYAVEVSAGVASSEPLAVELQLAKDAKLDGVRALELAAMLAGLAESLDRVGWSTWRTVNPKSMIRRSMELRGAMGRFVTGDPDINRTQIKQELEKLRQLLAALISAVRSAGGQFAQKMIVKHSPEEIEKVVKPTVGFIKSADAECWKHYKEAARSMDAASIEQELLSSIANFAESLMKGLAR
jgi:hypothetical protein